MKQSIREDSSKLREAYEVACDEILAVLKRTRPVTDITRVASTAIGSYSRLRSTEVHELGLRLAIEKYGLTKEVEERNQRQR